MPFPSVTLSQVALLKIEVYGVTQKIMHHEDLHLVIDLIGHCIGSLKKFKCNKLASAVFQKRLEELAKQFGDSYTSLMSQSEKAHVEIPDSLVCLI